MAADLRTQLDRDSFRPRGYGRETWRREARGFAGPVWGLVEALLGDDSEAGAEQATDFLDSTASRPPRVGWRGWAAALGDQKGSREQIAARVKSFAARLAEEPDHERVLPALVAAIAGQRRVALWGPNDRLPHDVQYAIRQHRLLEVVPLGVETGVACLLLPRAFSMREEVFEALCRVRTAIPTAARGAMWLTVWEATGPTYGYWRGLGQLHEPAAIAAVLTDIFWWESLPSLPPRPATTRGLARIVARQDPWLLDRPPEYAWSGRLVEEWPELCEKARTRAFALIPWAARAWGGAAEARAAVDNHWPSGGLDGAVAQALLGGLESIDVLIAALADADCPDTVFLALASLGSRAAAALPRLRTLLHPSAVIALASIEPGHDGELGPVIDEALGRAPVIREQYHEGLITSWEFAQWWWPVAASVAVWRALPSLSATRQQTIARVRAELEWLGPSHYPWLAPIFAP
jgi:hypothetical protein